MFEEYYTSQEGLDMFFQILQQLGGIDGHLMLKRPKKMREEAEKARVTAQKESGTSARRGEPEDEDDLEDDDFMGDNEPGQSFRADRRLVRILVLRYFADVAWRKFMKAEEGLVE